MDLNDVARAAVLGIVVGAGGCSRSGPVEGKLADAAPPAPIAVALEPAGELAPTPAPSNVATGCRESMAYMARLDMTRPGEWDSLSDAEVVAALRDLLWDERDKRELSERERQLMALAELDVSIAAESLSMYLEWEEGDNLPDALAGAKALGNAKLAALLGRVDPEGDSKDLDRLDEEYRALKADRWLAKIARRALRQGDVLSTRPGWTAVPVIHGLGGVREIIGLPGAAWLIDDDRCADSTRVVRVALDGKLVETVAERPESAAVKRLIAAGDRIAWLDGALVMTAPSAGGPARALGRVSGGDAVSLWTCPDGALVVHMKTSQGPAYLRVPTTGTAAGVPAEQTRGCGTPEEAQPFDIATYPAPPTKRFGAGSRACALIRHPGQVSFYSIYCGEEPEVIRADPVSGTRTPRK
jgi:hypothetical protein